MFSNRRIAFVYPSLAVDIDCRKRDLTRRDALGRSLICTSWARNMRENSPLRTDRSCALSRRVAPAIYFHMKRVRASSPLETFIAPAIFVCCAFFPPAMSTGNVLFSGMYVSCLCWRLTEGTPQRSEVSARWPLLKQSVMAFLHPLRKISNIVKLFPECQLHGLRSPAPSRA